MEAMYGTDAEAGQLMSPPRFSAQSVWKNFPDDLLKLGYQSNDADGSNWAELDREWGVGDALRGLGVNDKATSKGGNNQLLYFTHYDPDFPEDKNGQRLWINL